MRPSLDTVRKVGETISDNKGLVLGTAGAATFMTGLEIVAIAFNAHGDESHKANSLSKPARWVLDHAMWLMTTDRVSWSTAHVADAEVDGQTEGYVHHGMTDANLFPSYEIESYLRALESDPEKYEGFPTLPNDELIPNLDPCAELTHDEVRKLGSFSHKLLDSILGDQHQPKTDYTIEEAERILDTTTPRYTYGDPERKLKDEDYTSDEMAEILLRDSYSPALEPTNEKIRNGVFGTYKYNVHRFQGPTDLFRRKPELLPPMYENSEITAPANKLGPAFLFGATIVGFALYNGFRKGFSPKNVAIGATAGALVPIGGIYGPIKGGEIVNSGGHAGKVTLLKLFRMWRNKPEKIIPNDDGTYMTKIEGKGIITKPIMKLVSLAFVDELEGQPAHHAMPWRRRYAFANGLMSWVEAPLTSFAENRSKAKRFRFGLRPGKGFNLENGQRRPDMPNSAITDVLIPARLRTLESQKAA